MGDIDVVKGGYGTRWPGPCPPRGAQITGICPLPSPPYGTPDLVLLMSMGKLPNSGFTSPLQSLGLTKETICYSRMNSSIRKNVSSLSANRFLDSLPRALAQIYLSQHAKSKSVARNLPQLPSVAIRNLFRDAFIICSNSYCPWSHFLRPPLFRQRTL
jgi:hypothetical protein